MKDRKELKCPICNFVVPVRRVNDYYVIRTSFASACNYCRKINGIQFKEDKYDHYSNLLNGVKK